MADGGTGEAEDLLIELLEANHEFFDGALRFASKEPWDLLVAYVPTLDAMGHAVVGVLDPMTMGYREELADRMWPWLERLFARTIDGHLTEIRRRFPDATIVVVSDHGMEGSAMTVHPNAALRDAGLLTLDSKGQISLAATQALHISGNGGGVFINTTDRKDGIVGADQRESVKRLRHLDAPRHSRSAHRHRSDPCRFRCRCGWPGAGYRRRRQRRSRISMLAPGYDVGGWLSGDRKVSAQPSGGSGEHGSAPWHRGLHAVFFASGPGVAVGVRPGLVRAIDVAPTVAALMKLPSLPHAEGQALTLSNPEPAAAPISR